MVSDSVFRMVTFYAISLELFVAIFVTSQPERRWNGNEFVILKFYRKARKVRHRGKSAVYSKVCFEFSRLVYLSQTAQESGLHKKICLLYLESVPKSFSAPVVNSFCWVNLVFSFRTGFMVIDEVRLYLFVYLFIYFLRWKLTWHEENDIIIPFYMYSTYRFGI